jgi:hypothetical protein
MFGLSINRRVSEMEIAQRSAAEPVVITSYSALDIREAPLAKPHELVASGFKDALSCTT